MNKKLLKHLKELKLYGAKNNIPNVSEEVGYFLNMMVKISGARNVLEIGCANGYSTTWLAEAVRKNKGRVVSVDFSKPSFNAAKENLAKTGLSDVIDFYFGNALNVIPAIKTPKKFDFVFIDGEKRSYWDFWKVIENRLSDKAVIVFDDVIAFPEKTGGFMKKIKNVLGFDQVILPIDKDDGILLMIKSK